MNSPCIRRHSMSVEQGNSINEALVGGIKLAVKFVMNNISRSLLSVA